MDRLLEKFNLPRLNQEEIETMNNPITSTKLEAVIKILLEIKSPGSDGFTGEFYKLFLEELINAYLSKTLPKNCRGRNTSKQILQGHHHPDTKARQTTQEKKTTGQYH